MRYTNSKIKIDKDGKRYYKPTIVPNVPIKDSDIFVYPVFGDRFDTMAYRYYGDSNLVQPIWRSPRSASSETSNPYPVWLDELPRSVLLRDACSRLDHVWTIDSEPWRCRLNDGQLELQEPLASMVLWSPQDVQSVRQPLIVIDASREKQHSIQKASLDCLGRSLLPCIRRDLATF